MKIYAVIIAAACLCLSVYAEEMTQSAPAGKTQSVRTSMPGWVLSGLGDSVVQFWLVNSKKEVTYVHAGRTPVEQSVIEALKKSPELVRNSPVQTFDALTKVSPELAVLIESALTAPDAYVLLNISPELAMFKSPRDPKNPCPPCREQTNTLEALQVADTSKKLTLIHVQLGM